MGLLSNRRINQAHWIAPLISILIVGLEIEGSNHWWNSKIRHNTIIQTTVSIRSSKGIALRPGKGGSLKPSGKYPRILKESRPSSQTYSLIRIIGSWLHKLPPHISLRYCLLLHMTISLPRQLLNRLLCGIYNQINSSTKSQGELTLPLSNLSLFIRKDKSCSQLPTKISTSGIWGLSSRKWSLKDIKIR